MENAPRVAAFPGRAHHLRVHDARGDRVDAHLWCELQREAVRGRDQRRLACRVGRRIGGGPEPERARHMHDGPRAARAHRVAQRLPHQERHHEVQLELRPQVALRHLSERRVAHDARVRDKLADRPHRLHLPDERRPGAGLAQVRRQRHQLLAVGRGERVERRRVTSGGDHFAPACEQGLADGAPDAARRARDQSEPRTHGRTCALRAPCAASPVATSISSSGMKRGESTHRMVW